MSHLTDSELRSRLQEGLVIPACPLTLHADRSWSERHQRALVRYYHASGAGGLAVGVHSTQFAIRSPKFGLFQPILELVTRELDTLDRSTFRLQHGLPTVRIAGVCGDTRQAVQEAEMARNLGYHTCLLSMTAFRQRTDEETLEHCRRVAEIIPIMGFYLQAAVGGRAYPYRFWRDMAEIPQLVAIKIAPFNRYQTWDVVRAVWESGRRDVALYTGNDDNIILDLLTPFFSGAGQESATHETGAGEGTSDTSGTFDHRPASYMNGGLLGQWGVGTRRAVEMLEQIQRARWERVVDTAWLSKNVALTDYNAALFDAAHQFAGCIPGIMEVLRRQGIAPSIACLDPHEVLSPGQSEELDRVTRQYPELSDDEFIQEHLEEWLA